ncbi:MAG: autotransporter domain-containing protein, partial [Janthinobacterium lividum]
LGKTAYLKPFVDGHAVYVRGRAYAESGLSTFNLAVEAQGNTALAGAAGAEVGARIKLAGSAFVRPFASAAYEVLNNNDWSTTARFVGQPSSSGFSAVTPAPDRLGKFALGLDILAARNADLSFAYTPEVGTGYLSHAGVARLSYRF